ncbi:hypothetical protein DL96DRAFT_828907 [Flagelloscypha sp. PMI_526]|nr:hypothetical protein DL96DRAFT_828907 [Flagelloscypha sp. PMI_526]
MTLFILNTIVLTTQMQISSGPIPMVEGFSARLALIVWLVSHVVILGSHPTDTLCAENSAAEVLSVLLHPMLR